MLYRSLCYCGVSLLGLLLHHGNGIVVSSLKTEKLMNLLHVSLALCLFSFSCKGTLTGTESSLSIWLTSTVVVVAVDGAVGVAVVNDVSVDWKLSVDAAASGVGGSCSCCCSLFPDSVLAGVCVVVVVVFSVGLLSFVATAPVVTCAKCLTASSITRKGNENSTGFPVVVEYVTWIISKYFCGVSCCLSTLSGRNCRGLCSSQAPSSNRL